jgi:hypothetical protein
MARTPKQRKQVNNKWRKLDFMKVVSQSVDEGMMAAY